MRRTHATLKCWIDTQSCHFAFDCTKCTLLFTVNVGHAQNMHAPPLPLFFQACMPENVKLSGIICENFQNYAAELFSSLFNSFFCPLFLTHLCTYCVCCSYPDGNGVGATWFSHLVLLCQYSYINCCNTWLYTTLNTNSIQNMGTII